MSAIEPDNVPDIRQERREKKLRKKQEQIAKSGRSLAQMYRDAVNKRLKKK